MTALLLAATPLFPLLLLAALTLPGLRDRVLALLWLAPLPGLACALVAAGGEPFIVYPRVRLTLALDHPSALLLGAASLLWCAASVYLRAYVARDEQTRFAAWWLATMAGSLGVFVAGDLVGFYLFFALASLPAWGLVIHDRTPRAWAAGASYILLTVLGEAALLAGFALLAAFTPGDSLAIVDVLPALATAPLRDLAIGFLVIGFGLKAGLVPLHVWLPLAHPAAPMPASAVLSGAIIKAGIIGLIRFLPIEVTPAEWGQALVVIGFVTAFWGVAIGITQRNPKTVLAYSSVSQMGVVVAAIGMGLADRIATTPGSAAFYAMHHVLAKGALFLAVGVAAVAGGRSRWLVVAPALVLALGFGGMPLTGGWLAKAAVKTRTRPWPARHARGDLRRRVDHADAALRPTPRRGPDGGDHRPATAGHAAALAGPRGGRHPAALAAVPGCLRRAAHAGIAGQGGTARPCRHGRGRGARAVG